MGEREVATKIKKSWDSEDMVHVAYLITALYTNENQTTVDMTMEIFKELVEEG